MATRPSLCKLNLVLSQAFNVAVQIDGDFDAVDTDGTGTVHD